MAMMKWKKDVLYSIVISAFALLFITDTLAMDDSLMEFGPAKAGSYTRFWLWVLIALCAVVAVRAIKNRDTTVVPSCLAPASVMTIVTLGLYVLALDYFGFIVSTPIYTFGCMMYYTWKAKKFVNDDGTPLAKKKLIRDIAIMLIAAVLVTGVTYYVFTEMVGMLLPQWNL